MKNIISSCSLVLISMVGHAQFEYGYVSHTSQLSSVANGLLSAANRDLIPRDFKNVYKDIKGAAFFSNDWLVANSYSQKGVKYVGFKAMFDIYKNGFYLNLHDTVYNANTAMERFELFPNAADTSQKVVFSNQYQIAEVPARKYMQVLNEGKLTFLKYTLKEVQDIQTGIYTNKEQAFNDKIFYFGVSKTGQSISVTKLNKKNLQKILADKWVEVEKFAAKDSGLSFSSEDDWQKIISYYNSL